MNGCKNNKNLLYLDTADNYKNIELREALFYTYDDFNPCLEIGTSHNLFSGIESSGSSYKYTVEAPLNRNSDNINLNEHFQENTIISYISNTNYLFIYFMCIVFTLFLIVYVKKNNLDYER